MKQRLLLTVLLVCLLIVLSSCNQTPSKYEFNGNDGIVLAGRDYQASTMKVECSGKNYEERILSQPYVYEMHQTLSPEKLKGINIDYNAQLPDEYISIWFHDDTIEYGELSGSFGIYKNDIVIWTASPYTSYCEYYKAADGTFENLNKLISSAVTKS